jgi:hypothetical protein
LGLGVPCLTAVVHVVHRHVHPWRAIVNGEVTFPLD